ncbi:hypothetical protein PIIN_08627 [Serendipita indica DSM 11827]|uniref:F-box domain-containing protein n=1 Tax=Serendipita indica (strain DSM 11827) TaxID=1109443 RepID=G4TTN3_SERID|nr:hypothetical protein PIIN_08627 [Serendipita indica DSM 11827]
MTTPATLDISPDEHLDKVVDAQTPGRRLKIMDMPHDHLQLILCEAIRDSPADRLSVLGVCFLWRDILSKTHHLWTNLRIVSRSDSDEHFERLMWRLDVQIGRCGTSLLDVDWATNLRPGQTVELFTWIARRAPSWRWRSLVVRYGFFGTLDETTLAGVSDFGNLTTLTLYSHMPGGFLHLVNQSATPNLTYLGLHMVMRSNEFTANTTSIFTSLSRIKFPRFESNSVTVVLPENIKTLITRHVLDCGFPHITSLTVGKPNPFELFKEQHFPNLEYLEVMFTPLDPSITEPLRLTTLTTLIVTGNHFEPLALMILPNLQVLRILSLASEQGSRQQIKRLRKLFLRPQLNLSPTEELEVDIGLPCIALATCIVRMARKTKHVAVRFESKDQKTQAITRVFASRPTPLLVGAVRETTVVAPCLQTLEFRTPIQRTEKVEDEWRLFMMGLVELHRGKLESVKTVWGDDSDTSVSRSDF